MIKKIDFITIRVTLFFILVAWCIYLFNSLVWGILIGCCIFILSCYLYSIYEKKKRPYSYNQLAFYMAMQEHPVNIIINLLPDNVNYVIENNTIITQDKELIYVSFTFSPFSMGEMVKAVNKAKAKESNILTIVMSEADRKIYNVISRLNLKVNIINIKKLMKLMIKKDAIPNLKNVPKNKINISDIFNRQLAGRLMFSGTIIALMSILLPVKIYYLIIAGICLILGLVCFFMPNINKTEDNSILK